MSFNADDCDVHLFDLDDTLINTSDAFRIACTNTVTFMVKPTGDGRAHMEKLFFFSKLFGSGNHVQFWGAFLKELCAEKNTVNIDIQSVVDFYRKQYFDHLRSYDGVETYLTELGRRRKKIGIISNGIFERQIRKLSHVGLLSFFEEHTIRVSSRFKDTEKKPSAAMILHWLKHNASMDAPAVFYGDRNEDFVAGNLCGMTTVHIAMVKKNNSKTILLCRPNYTFRNWQSVFPSQPSQPS